MSRFHAAIAGLSLGLVVSPPFLPFIHIASGFGALDAAFLIYMLLINGRTKFVISPVTICLNLMVLFGLVALINGTIAEFEPDIIPFLRSIYLVGFLSLLGLYFKRVKFFRLEIFCLCVLTSSVTAGLYAWFCWFQSPAFFGGIPLLNLRDESGLSIINRNFLSFFVGTGVIASYICVRTVNQNFYTICLFIFLTVTLLAGLSKGYIISTVLSILFVESIIAKGRRAILNLVVLIGGTGLMFWLFSDVLLEFFLATSTNTDQRLTYISYAAQIAVDSNFLGYGTGTFGGAMQEYGIQGLDDPHNAILWLCAEYGVVATTCWILLISGSLFAVTKVSEPTERGLTAGLMSFFILSIFFSGLSFSMKLPWVLLAFIWHSRQEKNLVRRA